MFVKHKGPFTPTARFKPLLWSMHEQENVPTNHPAQSASIVDILRPFDRFATYTERDPGRIHSPVANAREIKIEHSLY